MLHVSGPQGPWRNWAGSVACRPRAILRPEGLEAIAEDVRQVAADGATLRLAGSGHSFTPLVATDDVLMTLERHTGLVSREGDRVRVRAGTTLNALGASLHAQGLAQENLGDIDVQSVAGALATGTHGTGARLGPLASQVTGLTLVTAAGEVLRCSAEERPDVFRAAQVSLGALGVVAEVELRVLPAYRLRLERDSVPLDAVLGDLERHLAENRHFEFFWFPYGDRVATKAMNPTEAPPPAGGEWGRRFNELVMENAAFWLISEACRAVPTLTGPACQLAGRAASTGVEIDHSHRLFATIRRVKFLEMEYALPREALPDVVAEIRARLAAERFAVHFPVEVRFGAGDEAWLSPAQGRNTAYVAVHMYRGMPHQAYFAAMEAIFRAHGGRPHWGKLHGLKAAELAGLYPHWEDFQAVRRRLDPEGRFLSPYVRELLEA